MSVIFLRRIYDASPLKATLEKVIADLGQESKDFSKGHTESFSVLHATISNNYFHIQCLTLIRITQAPSHTPDHRNSPSPP